MITKELLLMGTPQEVYDRTMRQCRTSDADGFRLEAMDGLPEGIPAENLRARDQAMSDYQRILALRSKKEAVKQGRNHGK